MRTRIGADKIAGLLRPQTARRLKRKKMFFLQTGLLQGFCKIDRAAVEARRGAGFQTAGADTVGV